MSVRQEIEIHPTAMISSDAVIGPGVRIGPYAVIGARVEIGEETEIGPHAVIEGPTSIGKHNRIIGQAAIGTIPQDLKYRGEESFLFIGDGNTIREFVTINRGTEGGGGKTTIGDQNLLMTGVHVAHDCHVGTGAILANSATLAGHVEIADYSNSTSNWSVRSFRPMATKSGSRCRKAGFLSNGSLDRTSPHISANWKKLPPNSMGTSFLYRSRDYRHMRSAYCSKR